MKLNDCPHCHHHGLSLKGYSSKGKRMYQCKSCRKNITENADWNRLEEWEVEWLAKLVHLRLNHSTLAYIMDKTKIVHRTVTANKTNNK